MTNTQPLAARLRPDDLSRFYGQQHLLAKGKPLYNAIVQQRWHSMILWGPPGCGKTTLAYLIAQHAQAQVHSLSAVLSGVKEIRQAISEAQAALKNNIATILFVDEVHRFNKAQQDAFLPYVEDGTIIFIGATTENPSFALNNALLSRTRVYVLKPLTIDDLLAVLKLACEELTQETAYSLNFPLELQQQLAAYADGDARRVLNLLDILWGLAQAEQTVEVTADLLKQVLSDSIRQFDKQGEIFYDQISALHKAVRGSSPDAALYWLARMLDGGCDPLYIARRVVRMASEDIGNADPRGLDLALNAWQIQERLGHPEGDLALAQAVVYLACAAKSNAVYTAFNAVQQTVREQGTTLAVPLRLRNAPTQLMKDLNYGTQYRYAHNEPYAYAAGENYFPDEMAPQCYYQPTDRGLEKKIADKLAFLRDLDAKAQEVK